MVPRVHSGRKTSINVQYSNQKAHLVSSGTNGSAMARTASPRLSIAVARLLAPRAVASALSLECSSPSASVTAPSAAGSPRSTPLPLPPPRFVKVEAPPGRKRPAARPSWRSRPVCFGALAPSRTCTDSHSRRRFSPAAAPRECPFKFASEAIHCWHRKYTTDGGRGLKLSESSGRLLYCVSTQKKKCSTFAPRPIDWWLAFPCRARRNRTRHYRSKHDRQATYYS